MFTECQRAKEWKRKELFFSMYLHNDVIKWPVFISCAGCVKSSKALCFPFHHSSLNTFVRTVHGFVHSVWSVGCSAIRFGFVNYYGRSVLTVYTYFILIFQKRNLLFWYLHTPTNDNCVVKQCTNQWE